MFHMADLNLSHTLPTSLPPYMDALVQHIPEDVMRLMKEFKNFYDDIRELAEKRNGWGNGPLDFHFSGLESSFNELMSNLVTPAQVTRQCQYSIFADFWLPLPDAPACRLQLLDVADEVGDIVIQCNPALAEEVTEIVEKFRGGAMHAVALLLREIFPQVLAKNSSLSVSF